MNKRRAAFTLPEVLVVIGIIAVLSLVLWAVMAPAMHVKAVETRIKSDLRQIAVAINVYANDYDGKLPYADKGLPKDTPRICFGCARPVQGPVFIPEEEDYTYPENKIAHRLDERYAGTVRHPFDPAIFPVAKALFFQKWGPGHYIELLDEHGRVQKQWVPRDALVPAVLLDGSLYWDYFGNVRDYEIADYLDLLLK